MERAPMEMRLRLPLVLRTIALSVRPVIARLICRCSRTSMSGTSKLWVSAPTFSIFSILPAMETPTTRLQTATLVRSQTCAPPHARYSLACTTFSKARPALGPAENVVSCKQDALTEKLWVNQSFWKSARTPLTRPLLRKPAGHNGWSCAAIFLKAELLLVLD